MGNSFREASNNGPYPIAFIRQLKTILNKERERHFPLALSAMCYDGLPPVWGQRRFVKSQRQRTVKHKKPEKFNAL